MNSLWQRFQRYFLRYNDIGFTIDISRMRFADDFLQSMGARAQRAFSEMRQLEAGAIANVDERRMVGHYWLRNPGLAPSAGLRNDIEETNARIKKFAAEVHAGDIVLRFDETVTRANLAVITKGIDELGARQARLKAEQDGDGGVSFPAGLAGKSYRSGLRARKTTKQ